MTVDLWKKVTELSLGFPCLETTRYLTRVSRIHQQAYISSGFIQRELLNFRKSTEKHSKSYFKTIHNY